MKKETKQLISIGFGYLATFLFVQDKFFTYIIALCIFVGLVLFWRKNLIQWMEVNYNLFRDIRKRKYFFVTEKGYKTDLKKRRDLGSAVYWLTNVGLIVIILVLSFINKIFGVQVAGLGLWLFYGGTIVAFLGILFAIRNYLTGLYYYLLPLIVVLFTIDYVHSYTNIKTIVIFIVAVLILYILLTLSLPLHSLRKITSSTWIFGVLTTFLIPLLLEYIFKYYVMDTIHGNVVNIPITIESLENSNISMEIISFAKKNPVIIELINRFRDISVSYELNSMSSELSVIRFLLLTSYSIGTIIITLKIKLGESKAKDIFSKIKSLGGHVEYSDLRDCIFYGGEKYEDKIMGNPYFESIILSEEESFDKYIEGTWWIKYPSKFVRGCSFFLKKLI
ncbi:hypothetical protein HMPREF9459_01697 [Streptococcus anginosus 1_2_62CV]|uniref:hypothetical protein n=1 Tax=Streptococcus anginosus TaxID=1328 RepID=UPI0001F60D2C|nr:hypothetical protein [Streptococcus anginosus]EFW06755.1 hypothetical protein HMPREF9459_01697 [Streptococcus anginosus 1_2_62CV]MCW1065927.1 hypothetical protein [Streptococcus anginosus]